MACSVTPASGTIRLFAHGLVACGTTQCTSEGPVHALALGPRLSAVAALAGEKAHLHVVRATC